MYLKDPSAHWEMIEALESRYKVEECRFSTILGEFEGHRIYASRKIAEKIEKQTRYPEKGMKSAGHNMIPASLLTC